MRHLAREELLYSARHGQQTQHGMALTHVQAATGKLEAIRVEFEWEDGAFHVFKERKRLPKDRRAVHGEQFTFCQVRDESLIQRRLHSYMRD